MTNTDFNTEDVINLIRDSKKKTTVIAIIKGNIDDDSLRDFSYGDLHIIVDEYEKVKEVVERCEIKDYFFLSNHKNSAIPLLKYDNINARIEPGSIIRDKVTIKDNAIIMMGAVINIGAYIGKNTMVDMNAVIGGRAIIGDDCHIGAGAVIAGVIEPISKKPVIIGNNVTIGANAVVLEGVEIKDGAVVGAGSVVTKDVEKNTVVVGSPAKEIKKRNEVSDDKVSIISKLRDL